MKCSRRETGMQQPLRDIQEKWMEHTVEVCLHLHPMNFFLHRMNIQFEDGTPAIGRGANHMFMNPIEMNVTFSPPED